ncbi:MAG: metal ABC transporter permease [Armatimonadetes bacterium]|nr:metal ABC transporter permease [Armatimonadota bacterium]
MIAWLEPSFVQLALMASALTGIGCASLGVSVVLRRIVFVGVALAQLASLGVALAVWFDWNPLTSALVTTLLGAAILALAPASRRLPTEGTLGTIFVGAWAFGILLLSRAPHGEEELHHLLEGNVLGVTTSEITQMAWVIGIVLAVNWIFSKEIRLSGFDPEMAAASGIRAWFWNLVFYLSVASVISVAIHAAGLLLVFTMLVVPPQAGLVVCKRMRTTHIVSLIVALTSSVAGVYLSTRPDFDLPTGPSVVAVSVICFAFALVISRLQTLGAPRPGMRRPPGSEG